VCDNGCVSLSAHTWDRLLEAGGRQRYPVGATLLRQGEPATHVLALTKGRVKAVRLARDGSVLVLAVRGPGEILGEIALLGGNGHSASVIAVDPCETSIIPAERFMLLVRSLGLETFLLRHAMDRIREGEEWRAELAALPSGPRVARALLRLALPGPRGKPDIRLDQVELGQATGLSRSTIAAELARLRSLGIITTNRRRIIIADPPRLRILARYV
jgi:CRP/FNR family cyclic AMP-dependent transcriptional regulator